MNGISQNLHKAIITHSRHAHDDVTSSLIEHARASLLFERSFKRELEAVKSDVKAIGQPRAIVSPVSNAPYMPPPMPSQLFSSQQQSTAGPSLPNSPALVSASPLGGSRPHTPSSSSHVESPSQAFSNGPPRSALPAGTQSMILPSSQNMAAGPSSPLTGPPRSMTTNTSSSNFDPLSQSAFVPGVAGGRSGFPGVTGSNGTPSFGSAGFAQTPPRNRIDQREAARKLANFL